MADKASPLPERRAVVVRVDVQCPYCSAAGVTGSGTRPMASDEYSAKRYYRCDTCRRPFVVLIKKSTVSGQGLATK